MHHSAALHGAHFFRHYCADLSQGTVIDIGALNVCGSLREACPPALTYVGVDCLPGPNVDVVLDDPYVLPFADASVDVVVCSSVLEHSDFFWLLFLEQLRVLKPGGLLYLNAPSNAHVHRYPVDSWRFYPDAGLSLSAWGRRQGHEVTLVESFFGDQYRDVRENAGEYWADFVAVFIKAPDCSRVSRPLLCEQLTARVSHVRRHDEDAAALPMDGLTEDLERLIRLDDASRHGIPSGVLLGGPMARTIAFVPRWLAPSAWVGHTPFACWLVQMLRPAVLVELGTHMGTSYFSFCQSVRDAGLRTRCHAIDTWQGDVHAGSYGEDVYQAVASHNQNYAEFSTLHRMTFDDALPCFADGSVDLLHIDGLHTYEAVRHDFETWLPKLAPGAVVLFHDTAVRHADFGVHQLWDELCQRYPRHLTFRHTYGLGVLQVDGGEPLPWLSPQFPQRDQLLSMFEALGAAMDARVEARAAHQRQLEDSGRQLEDCERQIDALKRSTSWRIMAGLRWLADRLRR